VKRRALAAGAAALALAAGVGPAGAAPASAACDEPGRPLWGTPRADGARVIARLDRLTLRPIRGSTIRLPDRLAWWGGTFSPDCERLAIPGLRGGRILVIDLDSVRVVQRLSAGGRAPAGTIAWPVADRLVALTASGRFVAVSLPGGRHREIHRERAHWFITQRTALGLAALAVPRGRVGAATLLLARPDGSALPVSLPRVLAGTDRARRPGWVRRQLTPALAVDETAARAYVVAAHRPLVAAVDLLSGAVSYHRFGPQTRRARAAKGVGRGAHREATWLGNGLLAVSGEDRSDRRDWRRAWRRGELPTRIDPFGLRLIDTTTWTARTLNPLLRWYVRAGPVLLGADAVPVTPRRSRASGLVAYGLDGRPLFERFRENARIGLWGAVWPYAHLTVRGRRKKLVIDLRTGRTVRVLAGTAWPFPLAG
jgi:hypothetical protein